MCGEEETGGLQGFEGGEVCLGDKGGLPVVDRERERWDCVVVENKSDRRGICVELELGFRDRCVLGRVGGFREGALCR